MNLLIFTDGGARGNPGPAAVGVVIKSEKDEIISQFGKRIGETTNNVAEYTAVVEALRWIKNNATMQQCSNIAIYFYLDSRLVVNQLNGLFKIKDAKLRNLLVKVRELEAEIGGPVFYSKKNFVYQAIPREENWQADKLVNEALNNAHVY